MQCLGGRFQDGIPVSGHDILIEDLTRVLRREDWIFVLVPFAE
jgi:hypothetical protein